MFSVLKDTENSQFRNPRGADLNRVCIAFTAVAAVFVAVRIGVWTNRRLLGLDDLFAAIALVYSLYTIRSKKRVNTHQLSSVILTVTLVMCVKFGFGLYSTDVAPERIVRIPQLHPNADPLYWDRDGVLWSSVEGNTGIICVCLPLLRPLIDVMFPWFARRSDVERGDQPRPYYTGPWSSSASRKTRRSTQKTRSSCLEDDLPFCGGDNDNAMIMSSVTVADRETSSRGSSEPDISQGIKRKVDFETTTELVIPECAREANVECGSSQPDE